MKIKISKGDMIITVLCVYFMSKMLWDSFTIETESLGIISVFEIISLITICYGFFRYVFRKLKHEYASVIALFIAFSAYILFDCFLKVSIECTFRAVYEYIFYAMIIFALGYYFKRCNVEKVVHKIHMFGLIIVILSWYEYITKSYLVAHFQGDSLALGNYGFRATVFTRSYLSHGIIIGFIALCAFYLFLRTNKKRYFASSIFCWISIFTTSSRGPLVATACALVGAFIINGYRTNKQINKRIMIWIGICVAALIALVFLTSSFKSGNAVIDYFLYRARAILDWSGDAGNAGRLSIWGKAIKWFRTDVLFGIGPSTTGSWGEASIGVTESGVLKRLCELGIAGFMIYYVFIFFIIKKGMNRYRELDMQEKIDFILFFSIIICVLINDITLQSTEEIAVYFILALGLGGLISNERMKKL